MQLFHIRKAIRFLCMPVMFAFTVSSMAQITGEQTTGGTYQQRNLVSDEAGKAENTDSNLINGWGIAFNPTGFVWVADNGTGVSTLYDGDGKPQPLVVKIPQPPNASGTSAPTGIVFNGSNGFEVTNGTAKGPSRFIFATEQGIIAGWSPDVDQTNAILMVDNSASNAVYKGLALDTGTSAGTGNSTGSGSSSTSQESTTNGSASTGGRVSIQANGDATVQSGNTTTTQTSTGAGTGSNRLFAADFRNNKIDVFDRSFKPVTLSSGAFADTALPADFAPFGIQAINGNIYVAYARQNESKDDEVAGAGLGYVNVFDANGNLVRRLISQGQLDAPWGMTLAPADFGQFSNRLLVGNFGDGKINAYDPASGGFIGTMNGADGNPIVIEGLWGIAFGNGVQNQPVNTLFFAAGPGDEAHGLYGRIDSASSGPSGQGTSGQGTAGQGTSGQGSSSGQSSNPNTASPY